MVAPPRISLPPVVQLEPGRIIDERYRIHSLIGEGGVGSVHLADDLTERRWVAIKVLNEDVASNVGLRERFERETRALFALAHPNIVAVHDFGVVEKAPYLVMEVLEGQTLESLLEEGALAPARALDIVSQLLNGLAFAHGQGLIHRDLKTANVFMVRTPDGRDYVKLLDFGLVKFLDKTRWGAETTLTAVGEVFGTPAYMSPEQAMGRRADARSDVYSVGVVLFEMLTGRWPFMVEDRAAMLRAHIATPVPWLLEMRPDLPMATELDTILQRALAKESAQRFADAREMAAAVAALDPRALAGRAASQQEPAAAAKPPGASPVAASGAAVEQARQGGLSGVAWIAIAVVAFAALACMLAVAIYLIAG